MNTRFVVFAFSASLPQLAGFMQRIAITWEVWRTTHSATYVGLVVFCDMVPDLFVTPLGSYLVDRFDRRNVMTACQFITFSLSAVLAWLVYDGLESLPVYLAFTLMLGASNSIYLPAYLATTRQLIDKRDLKRAVSLTSGLSNSAFFVGPMLAGFLLLAVPFYGISCLAAACSLPILVVLARLHIDAVAVAHHASWSTETMRGFSYVTAHAGIAAMLVVFAGTSVGGRGALSLFSGFTDAAFRSGPAGFAGLASAAAIGSISGAALMARKRGSEGLPRIVIGNLWFTAAMLLILACAPVYGIAFAAVYALGISFAINSVGVQTLLQIVTPEEYTGRVMAIYTMLMRGGSAVGALFLGGLASEIGFRLAFVAGAMVCVALWPWARIRHATIDNELQVPAG